MATVLPKHEFQNNYSGVGVLTPPKPPLSRAFLPYFVLQLHILGGVFSTLKIKKTNELILLLRAPLSSLLLDSLGIGP